MQDKGQEERKPGTGKLGEPTAPVRVPRRLADKIHEVVASYDNYQELIGKLKELVDRWDEKTTCTESAKNTKRKMARELWSELKTVIELCTYFK